MMDKVATAYFTSVGISDGEEEVEVEGGEDKFDCLHAQWITDTKSKSELRSTVGEWRNGRWTPQELETLKQNVKEFLELLSSITYRPSMHWKPLRLCRHTHKAAKIKAKKISDPAEIIFCGRHDEIRSEFYRYAARNIHRTLFSVYRKVYRDYNVENYVHEWSKDMVDHLLREHDLHGNRWAAIGRAIGVSARAARDKYRDVANRARKGEWLPEEEDKLVAAMKELHGDSVVDDMAMCSSVTWDQVASRVGSRNGVQCRAKWLFTWPGRPKKQKWETTWGHSENLRLLQCLMEQEEVEDEDDVDWVALSSNWESARSAHFLRNKWSCLRRHVPNHKLNSYTENLEYLVEHLMPALERQIEKETVLTQT